MIAGILKIAGFIIMRLVYGKDEFDKRWPCDPEAPKVLVVVQCILSIAFVFWLLSLLFWIFGIAAKDTFICAVYSIAFPVFIVVWTIIVRKRGKQDRK